jgi:hypothetical protein
MVTGPWIFPESADRSILRKIEACFSDRGRHDNRASQKASEASIKFSTAMVADPWAAVPASAYRGDGCSRRAIWILTLIAPSAQNGLAMASDYYTPNRGRGNQGGRSTGD